MAWGPQPQQIGNLALVRGGSTGGTLVERRNYVIPGTIADTVPLKASWLSVRVHAAGGQANGASTGGTGGWFARTDMVCKPGQALSIVVTASNNNTTPVISSVSLDGVVIAAAPTGVPNDAVVGSGIGQIVASGGRYAQAGMNGGAAGGTGTGPGGGAGGENNAFDRLFAAGKGGNNSPGGFPGGGGGTANQPGGDGIVFIEFWSAKP